VPKQPPADPNVPKEPKQEEASTSIAESEAKSTTSKLVDSSVYKVAT
jgi:hypothetical protein